MSNNNLGMPGTDSSVISEFLNQMRLRHAGGFSQLERQQWRSVLFNNLVMAFQNVFDVMTVLQIDFEIDDSKVRTFACEIVGSPLTT